MAAKQTVASLAERVDAQDEKLTAILAAVQGSAAPESGQAEETAQAAQEQVVKNLPPVLNTNPTPSGQGFSLGVAYATQTAKDGTVKRVPRAYMVGTTNGIAEPSENNQFGLLRANSIHPEVIRLIAGNPKGARKLADWVEQQQNAS